MNAVGIAYATLAATRLEDLKSLMDAIINAETAYVTPVLKALFLIYLGRQFLMMNYGYLSGTTFVSTVLRSGIVILLVTKAGAYVQYVRDPIFDRIPQALAAMASRGGGVTVGMNPAEQFDAAARAINAVTAQTLALNTGWSVSAFGNYLAASLSNGGAQAILACICGVWLLGVTMLAIVLCFGKVVLLFELFDRTRGWVGAWIGKLVGILAFGFGANILLALQMTELMNLLNRVHVNLSNNGAEAVGVLMSVVSNIVLDLLTMIALPAAVGFGSGIAASVAAPAVGLALRGGVGAAGTAGRALASTVRASRPIRNQNERTRSMRRALIPLLILAALAGCASDHKLATCKGPLIALNADRWHPTPEQLAAMSKACPEDS